VGLALMRSLEMYWAKAKEVHAWGNYFFMGKDGGGMYGEDFVCYCIIIWFHAHSYLSHLLLYLFVEI